MTPKQIFYIYEAVAFLFAISVHESAHAWTAMRCGDPTAYMLGRVTLNPIKHIDPFGTILMPLIGIFTGFGIFGWAKPTPVNPRNFKKVVKYDILTSVAGPLSNLIVATLSVLGMAIVKIIAHGEPSPESGLFPVWALLDAFMEINVLLAVFNILPIPPLDGSHVVRHLLPAGAVRAFDYLGMFGIILIFWFGGPIIGAMMSPFLAVFQSLLAKV
jgi:Zn-dependent protease